MMMTPQEVAEYVGMTVVQVMAMRTPALGSTETGWRCGESGRISESTYDCSCDSVLCDLGEYVTVSPKVEE